MTREAADDRLGLHHFETFPEQGDAACGNTFVDMRHVSRAQDDAKHQPSRNLVLIAVFRPAEPRPTQQSAVEHD